MGRRCSPSSATPGAPLIPVLTLRSVSTGPSLGSWVLCTAAMSGEQKVCVGLRAGCRLTLPTCQAAAL